jgi:hypothetical protein
MPKFTLKGKKDGKSKDKPPAGGGDGDDWSGDFKGDSGDSGDGPGEAGSKGPPGRGDSGGDDPKAQGKSPFDRGDGGEGDQGGALDDPDSLDGEEGPDSIRGEGDNGEEEGGGKVSMKVEPHEDGDGHHVHFHDEVSADLRGDADYQHHVTEHSKHMAGHLIHKDSDPDKAEAHRHAANLHARVGNALHAGGDTEPRRQQAADRQNELDQMGDPMMGPDGEPIDGDLMEEGEDEFDPSIPTGFGSDDWKDGDDVAFPGVDEESPREDAAGGEQPAKPDRMRNVPGRDSRVSSQRRVAKNPAPKLTLGGKGKPPMGKSLSKAGGPYIGPRGGKWADPQHKIPWKEGKAKPKPKKSDPTGMNNHRKVYPGLKALGYTVSGASHGDGSFSLSLKKDGKGYRLEPDPEDRSEGRLRSADGGWRLDRVDFTASADQMVKRIHQVAEGTKKKSDPTEKKTPKLSPDHRRVMSTLHADGLNEQQVATHAAMNTYEVRSILQKLQKKGLLTSWREGGGKARAGTGTWWLTDSGRATLRASIREMREAQRAPLPKTKKSQTHTLHKAPVRITW